MTAKITLTNYEKKALDELYNTSKSNQEIAVTLGVSVASVKFSAWNIYNKLGLNKRLQLKDLDPKFIKGLISENKK